MSLLPVTIKLKSPHHPQRANKMIPDINRTYAKWFITLAIVMSVLYLFWSPWPVWKKPQDERWANLKIHKNTFIDWKAVESTKKLQTDINWSKIKQRERPSSSETHEKWIVVTSVSLPTEQVQKLSRIQGWKLIVVADTKTPEDWNYPNVVFLSVKKQLNLGYKTAEILPFKSYSRKTLGYLYAIEHGAKIIYETDDDNYPYDGKIEFNQSGYGDFLVYKTDRALINPYEHFGQSTIWPRGYPLENIADPPQHSFVKCKNVRPLIQQGVVNGDPDVDAVFRLTRKDLGVKLDVEFDSKAPPVLLPSGSYAPFNSQNTLFLYDAFWGLMMPPGPTMRVTDIWRAYYDKRLLEEIDGYLAFYGPNAYQERNSHSYLADFIDEKALYHDAGRFIAFLKQWKSTKTDFFNLILELTVGLVDQNILEPIDAVVMEAWLTDLYSMGYKMPELKKAVSPCSQVIEKAKVLNFEEKPSSYIRLGKKLKNILKL